MIPLISHVVIAVLNSVNIFIPKTVCHPVHPSTNSTNNILNTTIIGIAEYLLDSDFKKYLT